MSHRPILDPPTSHEIAKITFCIEITLYGGYPRTALTPCSESIVLRQKLPKTQGNVSQAQTLSRLTPNMSHMPILDPPTLHEIAKITFSIEITIYSFQGPVWSIQGSLWVITRPKIAKKCFNHPKITRNYTKNDQNPAIQKKFFLTLEKNSCLKISQSPPGQH